MRPSPSLRPQCKVRTPKGDVLTVEYDRIREGWRVTPGGYESRSLTRALAQATGSREDASWITTIEASVVGRVTSI